MATVEEQVSPLRPCMEPGCPELVQQGPRCLAHTRQAEREINRAGSKVYATKRWKLTRRRKLSETPICERCGKELADTVHHKVDLADGGDTYAMENLESLGQSCHSKETRARQLGRAA